MPSASLELPTTGVGPIGAPSPVTIGPLVIHAGNSERAQYLQPPVIPGHEFAGEVVQLGEGMDSQW